MVGVREQLRRDLRRAMKERNHLAVRAIRSLLAAIDNAEAVPIQHTFETGAHVAGAAMGQGRETGLAGSSRAPT